MGGHGGLNILPQKRWNVYNRDNRLKVARDEAAHAAEQAVQQEKHRAAEAQSRRQLLLDRAKQRRATALDGQSDATGPAGHATTDEEEEQTQQPQQQQRSQAAAAEADGHRDERRANKPPRGLHPPPQQPQQQQALSTEVQEEPVLEHINFWKELETKAQHPERQAEERAKKKKRGNPDTYTTDERFDASFQLAHGLTGPKPWYARAVEPAATNARLQPPQQQQQQQQRSYSLPGVPQGTEQDKHRRRHKRRRKDSSSDEGSSTSSSSSDSSSDDDGSRERRERHRRRHRGSSSSRSSSRDRRERKRHKHSKHKHLKQRHQQRRSRGVKSAADEDVAKAAALAQLRSERLEREAAEKRRALEAMGLLPPAAKRFNNSYGYADALRRGQGSTAGVAAARGASAAAVAGLSHRFKV